MRFNIWKEAVERKRDHVSPFIHDFLLLLLLSLCCPFHMWFGVRCVRLIVGSNHLLYTAVQRALSTNIASPMIRKRNNSDLILDNNSFVRLIMFRSFLFVFSEHFDSPHSRWRMHGLQMDTMHAKLMCASGIGMDTFCEMFGLLFSVHLVRQRQSFEIHWPSPCTVSNELAFHLVPFIQFRLRTVASTHHWFRRSIFYDSPSLATLANQWWDTG